MKPHGRQKPLWGLLSCFFLLFFAAAQQQYDWEEQDYYEILGLDNSPSLDEIAIKKAYRKMAKQYHPDKTIHQANITVEEANKRFSRIAEAYQTLSDMEQRRLYDRFLAQGSGRKQRQQPKQQRNQEESPRGPMDFGFHFSWEDLDPRRIFEEMFGQQEGDDTNYFFDDDDYSFMDDFGFHSQQRQQQQQQYEKSRQQSYGDDSPDHDDDLGELVSVQEEDGVMYDPYSGQEILRVIRTEEYLQQSQGRYYTRVLARDFVEEWDPRSRSFVLLPLQHQPQLLHESFRPVERPGSNHYYNDRHTTRHNSHQNAHQRHYHHNIPPQGSSRGSFIMNGEHMMEHEYLSHGSYMAGVSSSESGCSLEVVQQIEASRSFRQLWSSESEGAGYFGGFHHDECVLQLLNDGRLVVLRVSAAGGQPTPVWSSSDEEIFMFEPPPMQGEDQFIARLENDGALVVYRAHLLPRWLLLSVGWYAQTGDKPRPLRTTHRFWKNLVRLALNIDPNTVDARSAPVRLSCQFSTSPGGCIRPARFLVHHARPALRFLKQSVRKVDKFLDDFIR